MTLIVRYGTMRHDRNIVAVIGAGDESERQKYYDTIKDINNVYTKKYFVDPEEHHFGAVRISRLLADSGTTESRRKNIFNLYFAQFGELDLRNLKGNKVEDMVAFARKLKRRFKKDAKSNLVVLVNEEVKELAKDVNPLGFYNNRNDEIDEYMKASFKEIESKE